MCKTCANTLDRENTQIRKIAGLKPFFCECCFKTTDKLQRDHIHGTHIFRGWICKTCNTGLGLFNDNLKGLLSRCIILGKRSEKNYRRIK